jgi:hypothetical protein
MRIRATDPRRVALVLSFVLSWMVSAATVRAQVCGPAGTIPPALLQRSGCQLSSLGLTPLSDLECGTYKGFPGGLYPGSSTIPDAHAIDGMKVSFDVGPRRGDGHLDRQAGRIGFASIGMSNTESEFSWMNSAVRSTPGLNPALVVVNGAQATRTAEQWADPASIVWSNFDQRLAAAGITPRQVQVVWIKLAEQFPSRIGAFPVHAQVLEDDLLDTLRNAKQRYPNLLIAYLSSRTRAYTTITDTLNPEPYAYESGFAVKWLVERQIDGDPALRFDGTAPPVPWIAWGPYLWADGATPRSDGFTWTCDLVNSTDWVHPFYTGQVKVAGELMRFLLEEPTADHWFREPSGCGLLGIEAVAPVFATLWIRRRIRRGRIV